MNGVFIILLIASRIKKLRKENNLTQTELAQILGFSRTTIVNYEKGKRYPSHQTIYKLAKYFEVSIDYIYGKTEYFQSPKKCFENTGIKFQNVNNDYNLNYLDNCSKIKNIPTAIKNKYIKLLINNKKEKAYSVIVKVINQGIKLNDIYLKIIEPALKEIGYMWEKNETTVAQEHIISNATIQIMNRLRSFFPVSKKNANKAVAVTAQGELHDIGLRMVSDFLEMDGWIIYYLGRIMPTDDIIKTIKNNKADILLISATMDYHINSIKNIIKTTRLKCNNVKIIVGGRSFNNNLKQVSVDGYAKNAENAVKVANNLIKGRNNSNNKKTHL